MSPVDLIWLFAAVILVAAALSHPWVAIGICAALLVWGLELGARHTNRS